MRLRMAAEPGGVTAVDRHPTGDHPIIAERAHENLQFAQRAVIVHQPEDWPTGPLCRNDHAAFPCQMHQWGRDVLIAAGWSNAAIAELQRAGVPVVGPSAADGGCPT